MLGLFTICPLGWPRQSGQPKEKPPAQGVSRAGAEAPKRSGSTDAGGPFTISQGPLKFNGVCVVQGAITTAPGAWPYPVMRWWLACSCRRLPQWRRQSLVAFRQRLKRTSPITEAVKGLGFRQGRGRALDRFTGMRANGLDSQRAPLANQQLIGRPRTAQWIQHATSTARYA